MTPQSSFMVAAAVAPERLADLRALLATMNGAPGAADPDNPLVPFGHFEALHVARFVVLEDETLGDLAAYGTSFPDAPVYLVFLGDCDGPAGDLLDEIAREAGPGLRAIFAHCAGFTDGEDLRAWMDAHLVGSATQYVNWVGRGVRQVREEAALHAFLETRLAAGPLDETAAATAQRLRQEARVDGPRLSPLPPPSLAWRAADILDLLGGALFLLVLTPFILLYLPVFFVILRRREASDAVIAPAPDLAKMRRIGAGEDHDVTNPFSALGSLKPGLFRLSTVLFVLWLLNWANRHVYRRGRLARVGTIHFARWVFLDGRRRLFFASNYDGALDSYMDDFINKAGFGLNLVFGNGVGYPRTRWLIGGGANDEQAFKFFLRRHQLITDVWYKAYPGLTTFDLARNAAIRQGLEQPAMSEAERAPWLALI
jgi:hypothetical protein